MTSFLRKHILLISGIIFLSIGGTVLASGKLGGNTRVLGEKEEITSSPTSVISPTATATPKVIIKEVPIYITTTPSPTTNQTSSPEVDVTALCKAKKQQMAGSMAETFSKAEVRAEAEAKAGDPMYYQVWLSNIKPNAELMMKNWTVKTLGEYESYCLLHGGSDSGWKPSSGPFDNISW